MNDVEVDPDNNGEYMKTDYTTDTPEIRGLRIHLQQCEGDMLTWLSFPWQSTESFAWYLHENIAQALHPTKLVTRRKTTKTKMNYTLVVA